MKKMYTPIMIILFSLSIGACSSVKEKARDGVQKKPNVIITTDINNKAFSFLDEQALVYLLWYSNNVNIQAIIIDRYNEYGWNRLTKITECYTQDYKNLSYSFQSENFQTPDNLLNTLQKDKEKGVRKIIQEARNSGTNPIYILILGNMKILKEALFLAPDIASKIRVISIGTGIKPPSEDVCGNLNWNGWGRPEIFKRFTNLWWVENDWAFKGMSEGEEPSDMYKQVIKYGALGNFLSDSRQTTLNLEEAIPFMFLVDPQVNSKYPEFGGWTGNYTKPFPVERPHYWVDRADTKKWDYKEPCKSWDLAFQVLEERKRNVLTRRDQMFTSLLSNLNQLYSSDN